MKKRWMQLLEVRTLRNRMLIIFAVLLAVPNLATSYSSYTRASEQLHEQMDDNTRSSVNLLNDTINHIVEAEVRNVEQLVQQIDSAQVDAKSPELRKLIDLFVEKHPELENLVVGNQNGAWMKAPDPGKQDYDPRKRDWYITSMENPEETVIIDPFVSATTGNFFISAAR
ncbi:PDC sensor domain-containing protein [Paenibacillus barengoltzii]|uniref:PDC sensor domain-containing protein n=1 Tax=Paenibacillus barengoltzii TaxID=343517 RepID=UPI002DB99496|nr:PDC sensor domain-containing protein [Paenibacillus barengoltzii]MEC2342874.1 PDC sensor domain-containing protein [Paenibacillus barengoltzii]